MHVAAFQHNKQILYNRQKNTAVESNSPEQMYLAQNRPTNHTTVNNVNQTLTVVASLLPRLTLLDDEYRRRRLYRW